MALTPNVVDGQIILASWGNEIRDRTNQVFATVAERDTWVAPPNGAICVTLDTNSKWQRAAGVWNYIGTGATVPRFYARAYRQAAFSATSGYTRIVFDQEATDPDNCYNPATGEYTVPMAGVYQCNANITVGYNNNPQIFIFAMFVDGAQFMRGTGVTLRAINTNDAFGLVVAGAVNFSAAGQKITFQLYNSGTNPVALDVGQTACNMMSISRLT